MQDSLFTKIIKGEVPCHKVYEDDLTLAFLDIHPIQPGQVLVVSKSQVEFVWDLDDTEYQAVMATAKKVALKLREVFPEKTHIALIAEGLQVPHTHLKLFPFSTDEEFRNESDDNAEPNHQVLAEIAARLAF